MSSPIKRMKCICPPYTDGEPSVSWCACIIWINWECTLVFWLSSCRWWPGLPHSCAECPLLWKSDRTWSIWKYAYRIQLSKSMASLWGYHRYSPSCICCCVSAYRVLYFQIISMYYPVPWTDDAFISMRLYCSYEDYECVVLHLHSDKFEHIENSVYNLPANAHTLRRVEKRMKHPSTCVYFRIC